MCKKFGRFLYWSESGHCCKGLTLMRCSGAGRAVGDLPHLDRFVVGTRRKQAPIGGEAHMSDISLR